jgi:hypothetical protein
MSACSAGKTASPVNLTNVDACSLLDGTALEGSELMRSPSPDEPNNMARCDYVQPNGADTLIVLHPGMSIGDFENRLQQPGRTIDRRDVIVAGVDAVEVQASTTRGGHTACAIITDFGQRQLVAVIDNNLGGDGESIDSMCDHRWNPRIGQRDGGRSGHRFAGNHQVKRRPEPDSNRVSRPDERPIEAQSQPLAPVAS